jgi:hypothetical protein
LSIAAFGQAQQSPEQRIGLADVQGEKLTARRILDSSLCYLSSVECTSSYSQSGRILFLLAFTHAGAP